METAIVSIAVLAAIAALGTKLTKDARKFGKGGSKDCGCGRGDGCKKGSLRDLR